MRPDTLALTASAAAFVVATAVRPGWPQAAADAAALALLALRDPGALRRAGRPRFWLFPAAFFALVPFFSGAPDCAVAGLPYSRAQLLTGAILLLHAYAFIALTAFLSRAFSFRDVAAFAKRLGLASAGLRASLALCAVKKLGTMLRETYAFYRARRPSRLAALRDIGVLVPAVLANAARTAEEIAVLFYLRDVRI